MPRAYTQEERLQIAKDRGILVDQEDEWLLAAYTWGINRGYAMTRFPVVQEGRIIFRHAYLHHCIVGQPIWGDDEIDHKDRNKLNDRRYNLRYVTKSQQQVNTSLLPGASGVRNVYTQPDGKFQVAIKREGVLNYLGQFDALDQAIAERDKWIRNND